jgi:alkyl sulfatase BDS1-like metallo-beta-lactamase superfamily hydrolase
MADSGLAQLKARESFEYCGVAQVVNHMAFADPANEAARALQTDALEQVRYQAESGPWRGFDLSGAQELREGVDPTLISNLKEQGKGHHPGDDVRHAAGRHGRPIGC